MFEYLFSGLRETVKIEIDVENNRLIIEKLERLYTNSKNKNEQF